MSRKERIQEAIGDFIPGQLANADSPQAAKLAGAFKQKVAQMRKDGSENAGALSLDADYEDGQFAARVSFFEDPAMTIMYSKGTDNALVENIFRGTPEGDDELCRLAGLMLAENWVRGYKE